jgi:hypothetical protein
MPTHWAFKNCCIAFLAAVMNAASLLQTSYRIPERVSCHAPRLTALVFGINNLCSGACPILMQNFLIRSRPCNQNHRKATENPEHRPAGVRAGG